MNNFYRQIVILNFDTLTDFSKLIQLFAYMYLYNLEK